MKGLLLPLAVLLMTGAQAEQTSLEAGQRLYFESGGYGCAVCHGLGAEGGGQAGGDIRGASLERLNQSLAENDPMKPLATVLSETDRQNLIDYLTDLAAIPLVQLTFENGQWSGLSEPLKVNQRAEIVLYNATFEEQAIDLSALGLGQITLQPLARDRRQWVAQTEQFSLPGVALGEITTVPQGSEVIATP
jgi:cytochrome c553